MNNHVRRLHRGSRAAVGLAALMAASVLAGCTTSSSPDTSSDVESFDWKNYEGEELNLLMSEHPVSAAIKENLPDFEEKTGISVNLETLSESDYMVKILTELQSGSGNYDAFMTSQPMNYQYAAAGWIEDLQPWVDDAKQTAPDYDFDDFFPALIEAQRWDTTDFGGAGEGGLWAIPANEEGYALFYRKDILEANSVEVPQTIDELIAAAKKLDGTEFEGKTINGFVSRGDKTFPTLNPFSTFAGAYGVKDITDGKATVNSPEGVEAVSKWVELMQTGPQAASTYTWYEAQQDFLAGTSAFYIDADHMAPDFEKEGSAIAGKVGYALPPEGPEGRSSSLWVWSLGMNAASEHKGAAWQFIQWATSKELLTTAISNGNMNPTRVSVADSPEMAAATEGWGDYNTVWKEILADHASWPYAPSSTWTEVGDIWATAIQSAILEQASVEEALDDAAAKIDAAIE
ncbi:ABC transporter substrate-binding protein [Microbacterium sp. SA39]|uniref:ABC transporter substrate-binding protein n=1 Tax=Microbacterium sp. SA39 TaxID=1263625 RepID=UPI00061F3BF5|nr:sugar ABC transporter substrate-binding protein [Microbacterium sp. SA39]KJQ54507.1 putative ABC transporter-binding protein precursor [Microbacterium sp. SA39]